MEMSFFKMIWEAGFVVQIVILILFAASILSWSVMINKFLLYRQLKRHMDSFEKLFWSGKSLDEVYRMLAGETPFHHTTAALFLSGMREWRRSQKANAAHGIGMQTRISKVMDITLNKECDNLEKSLNILATIGSTAPFIGLFGTVWGIMTSFQAIAISQNTNLAAVAPGISEALLVTAIGLAAAIPAVIGYNRLLASSDRLALRMESFSDEFSAIISRKLDIRGS